MAQRVQCKSDLSNDNTAASVTVRVAASNASVFITGIVAGYSADPSAAKRLTVEIGGTEVFGAPITKGGPAPIDWDGDWYIDGGTGLVEVKLPASGTAGTTGDLCVFYRA